MKKFIFNPSLNNISIFLLLSFPICLVLGPLLAEISMNIINIFFLFGVFKEKKFKFLNDKFFIFFLLFYFYIFLTIIFSNYTDKIFFKHIFYFRHAIFVFAIADLLQKNKNLITLFYKVLLITILIVCLDGIIQFLFEFNSIGYPKIRADRLTGFFEEKMILGSYVARLFPLLLGLYLYNYKFLNKKNILIGIFTLIICFTTIVLSGERMAFLTSFTYVLCIFILLNYSKRIKFFLIVSLISTVTILIFNSPTLMNRHFQQTIDQVNFKFDNKNFFSNFVFYKDIYQTAFNGFLDNKIIGQGARSYRYFCSEKDLLSETSNYYNENLDEIGNKSIYILKVYLENNQKIKTGDIFFKYVSDKKIKSYYLKGLPGIINSNLKEYENKHANVKLIWAGTRRAINGCTSHPHNFYLQLLSETGLIGFIFIFSLFSYFVYISLKNFILLILNKKANLSNPMICILFGFIITLLPIIPNGNFFNNWLSMIMYFPGGFYLFLKNKNIHDDIKKAN